MSLYLYLSSPPLDDFFRGLARYGLPCAPGATAVRAGVRAGSGAVASWHWWSSRRWRSRVLAELVKITIMDDGGGEGGGGGGAGAQEKNQREEERHNSREGR